MPGFYEGLDKHYGQRGITVCNRWRYSFENFYSDVGPRPSSSIVSKRAVYSLERIDNDKGYAPDNCVWADHHKQMANTRANILLTYNGVTRCVMEWARESGINHKTILKRLRSKWSIEKTLTTPPHNLLLTYNGVTQSVREWARESGINHKTLRSRLCKKWSVEKTLTTPVRTAPAITLEEVCLSRGAI